MPPLPPEGGDAGACAVAYHHLAVDLYCPPPAPRTGTWTGVCENARAHAHEFGLACLRAATTCEGARRCLSGDEP